MPELPALPLGQPATRPRTTGSGHRPRVEGPGAQTQQRRIGPALQRLTDAFEAQRLGLLHDPAALQPEQVLVLEIAGEIDEFVNAVRRVPGLEFLAEEMEDKVDPDDFAAVDSEGRHRPYARQLFLIASDQAAWQQLLGLWDRFQRDEPFPRGLTPFRHLFALLRELRPWDDRDRLERTGALEAWERELTDLEAELVEFEAELWLRSSSERREEAVAQLRADLENAGGELVHEVVHEAIDYHGVLGRVPARLLLDAVRRHEVRWIRTGSVRFFHAMGQMAAPTRVDDDSVSQAERPAGPAPAGAPRIALLDGVPLARHALLHDRLLIDDPDDHESLTPVARRLHGTGMASLVLHGDLDAPARALNRRLYVRPILAANAPGWVRDAPEEVPRDRLPVDLVHQAVARLFDGDAVAPDVRVVILAIGDAVLQFNGFVSPLARLLDWLAHRYRILFLLSAGNHLAPLNVGADISGEEPLELQHEVLCALARDTSARRLLSPAESINAITIGAAHSDASGQPPADDRVDPITTSDLANVASAMGAGVRRSVKPDILLPGGRQMVRLEPPRSDGSRLVTIPPSRRPPGIRVACPAGAAGVLDATASGTGTSLATGLAGHHAGHLLEILSSLRDLYGASMPDEELDVVLVKAALVHGARWGSARAFIDHAQDDLGRPRSRDVVARAVGYGYAEPQRALTCDDHLVTVFAGGVIADGAAHAYAFPLPPSLASRTERRRVTLTLAWLTPINARHRAYRRAALKLEPGGFRDFVGQRTDVDSYGTRRGTVQHEVLEGQRAVPFAPGTSLELQVSCRADAGALDVAVPYAVIASLEVPVGLGLPIYEEVRQALRVPVTVRAVRL